MKPSLEEVTLKILELAAQLGRRKHFIKVAQIIEALDEHPDNLMPSLLQLERDAVISFDSNKRIALRLVVSKAA